MALVLCTGFDRLLLETRRMILERAGHTVIPATSPQEAAAACKRHQFDVAVMGQSVSSDSKRAIASVIRRFCPSTKILELYQSHQGKAVSDADSWLEVPTGVPQELAEHVSSMARSS